MDWTDKDEQDWQSLLASEPASSKKTLNQNGDQMLALQAQQIKGTSDVKKGVQFLSPKHVTTPDGFKAKIVEVTTDQPDTFGNPVVVYFSLASDGLRQLVNVLGLDETKWVGKIVTIAKRTQKRGGEQLTFSK